MIEEKLVSIETAILAKEKGFINLKNNFKSATINNRNEKNQHYSFYEIYPEYLYDGIYPLDEKDHPKIRLHEKIGTNSSMINSFLASYDTTRKKPPSVVAYHAPTQAVLQRWLRDNHNIHVESCMYIHEGIYKFKYKVKSDCEYDLIVLKKEKEFSGYEEALEVGLQEGLEYI